MQYKHKIKFLYSRHHEWRTWIFMTFDKWPWVIESSIYQFGIWMKKHLPRSDESWNSFLCHSVLKEIKVPVDNKTENAYQYFD